jgi:hypothetical protein
LPVPEKRFALMAPMGDADGEVAIGRVDERHRVDPFFALCESP